MQESKKAYLGLHFAVLLWGLTGILGAKIALPALIIVWWRTLFTAISYLPFIKWGQTLKNLSKQQILTFAGIGVLVCGHWMAFYGSIKLANASIGMVCMAATTLFTAVFGPLINKYAFNKRDLIVAAIVIPGMWLIVETTKAEFKLGFWVGILSAALASLFTIYNKRNIHETDIFTISFIEMTTIFLILTGVIGIMLFTGNPVEILPVGVDWMYLIILSLLCTTLAFALGVHSLKFISAFHTNLIVNLEPVYGVIMAIFLLNEHKDLTTSFYVGVLIVFAAVFFYPMIRSKEIDKM